MVLVYRAENPRNSFYYYGHCYHSHKALPKSIQPNLLYVILAVNPATPGFQVLRVEKENVGHSQDTSVKISSKTKSETENLDSHSRVSETQTQLVCVDYTSGFWARHAGS